MQKFTPTLLKWYATNKRDFPWRNTNDPYKIWVSEIMSHQTQINRVAEHFYPHFIEKFPTLLDLAGAKWKEVYSVWEGLGYYSRGKNMLRTAEILANEFNAQFPKEFEVLIKLPGIGTYTAAAIQSFAFNKTVPAIDTNLSRIISTLWPNINIPQVAKKLISTADSSKDWNSAMMDLASFLREGRPISPPLDIYFPEEVSRSFLPSKNKTSSQRKKPHVHCIEVGIACIWREDGKYLIQSRPEGKSFVGRWEFPGGKREKGEDFRKCVKREIMEELGIKISVRPHFYEELCQFKRANLLLKFHRCQIQSGTPKPLEKQELKWVEPTEFRNIKFLDTNAQALERLKKMKS